MRDYARPFMVRFFSYRCAVVLGLVVSDRFMRKKAVGIRLSVRTPSRCGEPSEPGLLLKAKQMTPGWRPVVGAEVEVVLGRTSDMMRVVIAVISVDRFSTSIT